MVRYSFLVRLFHPLLHAGLSRRILDHPIRPREYVRWKHHAYLLGRSEFDDKFKFRRLLDGQVGGLGALENFVHIGRSTAEHFHIVS